MALLTNKYVWIGLVMLALGAYGLAMKSQRDAIRAEYAEYRTQVAVAAQAAAEQALKKTIEDEKRKEEADVENLRLVAALNAATRRLRDARAGSNFVPATPACPARPESACLDRTQLEHALRTLDTEVQSLVDEGSRAVIDLDTAKRWAQER